MRADPKQSLKKKRNTLFIGATIRAVQYFLSAIHFLFLGSWTVENGSTCNRLACFLLQDRHAMPLEEGAGLRRNLGLRGRLSRKPALFDFLIVQRIGYRGKYPVRHFCHDPSALGQISFSMWASGKRPAECSLTVPGALESASSHKHSLGVHQSEEMPLHPLLNVDSQKESLRGESYPTIDG